MCYSRATGPCLQSNPCSVVARLGEGVCMCMCVFVQISEKPNGCRLLPMEGTIQKLQRTASSHSEGYSPIAPRFSKGARSHLSTPRNAHSHVTRGKIPKQRSHGRRVLRILVVTSQRTNHTTPRVFACVAAHTSSSSTTRSHALTLAHTRAQMNP